MSNFANKLEKLKSDAIDYKQKLLQFLIKHPHLDEPLVILSQRFDINKETLLAYLIILLPIVLIYFISTDSGKFV